MRTSATGSTDPKHSTYPLSAIIRDILTLVSIAGLIFLIGCKKDKPTYSAGWDGITRMTDSCNYATAIHEGALLDQAKQIIPVSIDPIARPLDKFAVLICYDVECTNPYKSTSCTPMRSTEPCFTSMPSPHIGIAPNQVIFYNAYSAGFRGYFISEAVCN